MDNQSLDKETKPRMSRLAIAAVLMMVIPIIYLLTFQPYTFTTAQSKILQILDTVCVLSLAASTWFGLLALLVIKKSKIPLRGKKLAIFVAIFPSIMLLFVSYVVSIEINRPSNCGTNLRTLVTAISDYASHHDDQLPDDFWCDRLIQDCNVSLQTLKCPASDLNEGECSYALNKYVLGHKLDELPYSMIILFETKNFHDHGKKEPIKKRESFAQFSTIQKLFTGKEPVILSCWNQIAGPEALSTAYHNYEGCNVAFADGHSEYVPYKDLSSLKWSIEDPNLRWVPEPIPDISFKNAVPYKSILFILMPVIVIVLFLFKRRQMLFYLLSFFVFAIAGLYLAKFFKVVPRHSSHFSLLEYRVGLLCCGFIGILYAIILIKLFFTKEAHRKYNLLVGIGFGVACALLINLILYNSYGYGVSLFSFYVGIPVGAAAAAVLNMLFDLIIKTPVQKGLEYEG